ncbi:hypothetical protein [Glutamicibacter sp. MCAF14]|uniref:hypothetical protein n=1 Tax=Glutamicibacter sp. MCAF14 TaxID=3233043 RepID=UPI003F8EFFA5
MSANEKHDATSRGREYTPDTESVRMTYCLRKEHLGLSRNVAEDNFNRWLETVRAEAKAEACKDAADALHAEARWQTDLLLRHEEYRFRHCSNRVTEMENVMLARANQYKEESVNGC